MKPIISEPEHKLLSNLITRSRNADGSSLGKEISRAIIVDPKELPDKTIRLNSVVEVLDLKSNRTIIVQIVMPDEADLKLKKISVFAPLSVALLGYKEDDVVSWQMPAGDSHFRILKVKNE